MFPLKDDNPAELIAAKRAHVKLAPDQIRHGGWW